MTDHLCRVTWTLALAAISVAFCTGADAVGEPPLAVIPTIGIGGPLAILALLFPSLFGGSFVLLRQWATFFIVFSATSLLVLLHALLGGMLVGAWWGTQSVLWLSLTFLILGGVLYSWRRSLRPIDTGYAPPEAPPRTEYLVLALLSVCCLAGVGLYVLFRPATLDSGWLYTFAVSIGIWSGMAFKLWSGLRERLWLKRQLLPTEGVMLWGMLVAAVVFLSWQTVGGVTTQTQHSGDGQPLAVLEKVRRLDAAWLHNAPGMVLSTPQIDGDRVYLSVAHQQGFGTFGAVYCLDRHTGKTLWTFDDGGGMKQIFSSPKLADGRLCVGEGFHYDPACKLYCLDAKSGKKLWDFPTASQTESTPLIADGKVFFGAGNDGVYAADAATGKMRWRYGPEPGTRPLFRVGGGLAYHETRLYFGSGVDRDRPHECETALACVESATGKQVWKITTDLPCWSTPVVAGAWVYFALGNGDLFTDADRPAGRVLCLSLRSGKERWRFDVPNGVHGKPAIDSRHVYFGSRDGHCYCVGRFDGRLRWKANLGSPILAAPLLDQGDLTGRAVNVFVLASKGRIACLDAASGEPHWVHNELEQYGAILISSPQLVSTPSEEGTRRQIYFGASVNNMPAMFCVEDVLSATKPDGGTK